MTHKMVYAIGAGSWQFLEQMKAGGIVDYVLVGRTGELGDSLFVRHCNDLGLSPIFQNSDSGSGGIGPNNPDTYMRQLVNFGYHAVGGESESTDEMHIIQRYLPFYNMGGEWGGRLSDMFALHPGLTVHDFGMVSYLETYKADKNLYMQEVVDAAYIASKAGCREVGFLVGYWMNPDPTPYRQMVYMLENKGVVCNGFLFWTGYTPGMIDVYNKWRGVIQSLQQEWPPLMVPMRKRLAGQGVTPEKPKTYGDQVAAWFMLG